MDNADLLRCLSFAASQHMGSHVTVTAELHWRCWWTWIEGLLGSGVGKVYRAPRRGMAGCCAVPPSRMGQR